MDHRRNRAITPGAQTERRGEAGPVRACLAVRAAPARWRSTSREIAEEVVVARRGVVVLHVGLREPVEVYDDGEHRLAVVVQATAQGAGGQGGPGGAGKDQGTKGSPGLGVGGGLYIETDALVVLDAF